MTDLDRIKAAYKKLKANLYFDKTQLPLRDRVVLFEQEDIDDKLNELKQALIDGKDWEQYEQQILEQIGVLLYPKKLEPISEDTAIFNADNIAIEICSPVVNNISSSRLLGEDDISLANFIKWSVVLPIAETTTTT